MHNFSSFGQFFWSGPWGGLKLTSHLMFGKHLYNFYLIYNLLFLITTPYLIQSLVSFFFFLSLSLSWSLSFARLLSLRLSLDLDLDLDFSWLKIREPGWLIDWMIERLIDRLVQWVLFIPYNHWCSSWIFFSVFFCFLDAPLHLCKMVPPSVGRFVRKAWKLMESVEIIQGQANQSLAS